MKKHNITATAFAVSAAIFTSGALAHDGGSNDAGMPVCLEANYMVADAQNAPFASADGPGRVIEHVISELTLVP